MKEFIREFIEGAQQGKMSGELFATLCSLSTIEKRRLLSFKRNMLESDIEKE